MPLVMQSHAHHADAVDWFERVPDQSVALCRLTQAGMLRTLTSVAIFNAEALTMRQAWDVYDQLAASLQMGPWLDEPQTLEDRWRQLTSRPSPSSKLWSDAILAAFAIESNATLVTFDRGFRQFAGLHCQILGMEHTTDSLGSG